MQALPKHWADMAAFSLATGWRAANVTGLQWSHVDLTRRLAWALPIQAKARRAIAVPLNAEAMRVVQKQLRKLLAALAERQTSLIEAQFGHSQF